jgi:hypothetical protein
MNLDLKHGVNLAQKGQVHLSVVVIPKDVPVSGAAVHRVVPGAGIFDSQWARHVSILARNPIKVQT